MSQKKATQFIQLANKNNIPILFVHNTTGFMVGKRHGQNGMVNHGAQLIHAVAGSEVPHITLIVGSLTELETIRVEDPLIKISFYLSM